MGFSEQLHDVRWLAQQARVTFSLLYRLGHQQMHMQHCSASYVAAPCVLALNVSRLRRAAVLSLGARQFTP
jgi:hypothetical protein